MTFVEFVGFVLSLVVVVVLVAKRFIEDRKQRLKPEEYAKLKKRQEKNLQQFLRSISGDLRSDDLGSDEVDDASLSELPPRRIKPQQKPKAPSRPPFARLPEVQKSFSPQKESYTSETASDKKRNLAASEAAAPVHPTFKPADSYEVIRTEKISPGIRLIQSLKSPQDMLVIKEIFDKPLALRDSEETRP